MSTEVSPLRRAAERIAERMLERVRQWRLAAARYWNVVRPGWPVPVFSMLAALLLLGSTQGREALHVVGDPDGDFLWRTFSILILVSVVQYGVFLIAVCRYYESFSDRAFQGAGVRLFSAIAVGLFLPLLFFLFYFSTEGFFGAHAGQGLSLQTLKAPSAAMWAMAVLLALGVAGRLHVHRRVRLQLSPFSAIVRINPNFMRLLGVIGALGAAILIAAAVDIEMARSVGPVGLSLLALTLWSAVWTVVAMAVEKFGLPPTPVVAISLAAIVSLIAPWATQNVGFVSFDRNQVDTIARRGADAPVAAPDYASRWLEERIGRGEPVRAIIVIAEGGGIRAALQTAALLRELDAHYGDLYVLSGVSGGSVGIAQYLAARAEPNAELDRPIYALRQDHLTPTLATMYVLDWPMAFVPTPTRFMQAEWELPDRARDFERSLARESGAMSGAFLEVVQAARRGAVASGPVVLLNTTRTADGAGEVVSNVTFPDVAGQAGARLTGRTASAPAPRQTAADRLCNVLERLGDGETLSMATAAHLSARFPFVSPPGAVRAPADCSAGDEADTLLRYVDGGYLDNSGALSASQAVNALERVNAQRGGGRVPIEYVVIHIYTQTIANQQALRSNDLLPELTGPLDAVLGARVLQGLGPIASLCRQVRALSGPPIEREAADDQMCDRYARRRTVDLGAVEAVALQGSESAPSIGGVYTLLHAPLAANDGARAEPYWIAAPLWTSPSAQSRERFVPLGWVLSGNSADYVVGQMQCVGAQIARMLQTDGGGAAAAGPCSAGP